jgi:hypothetical protein
MRKSILIIAVILVNFYGFSQGLNRKDSLELNKIFYKYKGNLPGALVCVMQNENVLYESSFGLANIVDKEELSVQHYFYLSTMGKIFTTLAILNLYENEKLDLNENLKEIFPELPEYCKQITINNLLSHSSGLLSNYNLKQNNEITAFLVNTDSTIFEPGIRWGYSNLDYPLLALIVERKSKKEFPQYLDKEIFKKLKTSRKHFPNNKVTPLMIGHKAFSQYSFEMIDKNLFDDVNLWGEENIYFNLDDFKKLNSALFFNKRFLNEETRDMIFNKVILNNNEFDIGLGWKIIDKNDDLIYWIASKTKGFQNIYIHSKNSGVSVLIITNRNNSSTSILKVALYIAKLANE